MKKVKSDSGVTHVYMIESSKHGAMPGAFVSFFEKRKIAIDTVMKQETDMVFCRGHDLLKNDFVKLTKNIQITYGLYSGDFLASKRTLARYGSRNPYLPVTYERENFRLNDQDLKICYVFKKNVQRQKGILLACSKHEIESIATTQDFDVVQRALVDPYLIAGRKINFRVYVMLIYDQKKKSSFQPMEIYDDGFVYYCKEVFDPSNITMDNFITTGYIDRSIYEKNPLTIKDATNHMNVNHESFMNKIRLALQSVFTDTSIMRRATMLERYADTQIVSKGKRFLIFGADIALSKEKDIHIMEINKGPDLNAKDGRDGMLKKQMIETFMKKVIN